MEQGLLPMPGLSAQSSETPDGGPDDYDMVAEPEVVIDDGEIDRKWIKFLGKQKSDFIVSEYET